MVTLLEMGEHWGKVNKSINLLMYLTVKNVYEFEI
jgi:hypothetical protein